MKRLSFLAISLVSLVALSGIAQADVPAKEEGRVWYDQNLTLAFTPEWSFTVMPGMRFEYARSREDAAGVQFLEFFIGPNYTYKMGNLTLKGSLWYYYMGYPSAGASNCRRQRDRTQPSTCTKLSARPRIAPQPTTSRTTSRSFPRLSTDWAAGHSMTASSSTTPSTPTPTTPISTGYPQTRRRLAALGLGHGAARTASRPATHSPTDSASCWLTKCSSESSEDSDTSKIAGGQRAGYKAPGYWKDGFRQNRTYVGIDFKVTPALTVTPMYMLEIDVSPTDSGDVSDMSHNLFIIATYVAKMFDDKK
jgi:hypothetical protein